MQIEQLLRASPAFYVQCFNYRLVYDDATEQFFISDTFTEKPVQHFDNFEPAFLEWTRLSNQDVPPYWGFTRN